MPIQSPAKDLRKTSAGALFGQGREMGSAQPSERPSQGLCPDRGAKRSQNSPPKDLEKPFKGRCAVADPISRYSGASGQKTRGAPVIRMLPSFGKRTPARDLKGARGSVRAMPEHSTCRYGFVVTDEHRTNCNTRSPRSPRSNRGLPDGNRPEPARSFRCSGSWSNPRRCTGRSRRRCAGR